MRPTDCGKRGGHGEKNPAVAVTWRLWKASQTEAPAGAERPGRCRRRGQFQQACPIQCRILHLLRRQPSRDPQASRLASLGAAFRERASSFPS